MLPELEVAYDLAESNLPRKTLMVVDSIDALSERYGISSQRIVNTLQKDLVESSGTNVIYTLEESGKTEMDYLGDGVVQMVSGDCDGRRVRQMIIEKLRGQPVEQWKYFFTLVGGRMSVFEPTSVRIPERMQRHSVVKDPNHRTVSSGNQSMDQFFGGFPNYQQRDTGDGVVFGCLLIRNGHGIRKDVSEFDFSRAKLRYHSISEAKAEEARA
jgi:hypothetical protein